MAVRASQHAAAAKAVQREYGLFTAAHERQARLVQRAAAAAAEPVEPAAQQPLASGLVVGGSGVGEGEGEGAEGVHSVSPPAEALEVVCGGVGGSWREEGALDEAGLLGRAWLAQHERSHGVLGAYLFVSS